MNTTILEKTARLFLWIVAVLSVILLLRGHNLPGGGFIAGIVLSVGFIFYGIVFGSHAIQKIIKYNSRTWMGIGLLLVLISAIIPVLAGSEVMTGTWLKISLPLMGEIHLGTPLLFDTGIFVTVAGLILSVIISIIEVLEWNT